MEKGFWWREGAAELSPWRGTCVAETQHNHYTHGLSSVASLAVKSHVVSTGASSSPDFGEFSAWNFLLGGSLSSSICLCQSQKHQEGSWAGTSGALSSPVQGLVSQHLLGLAGPWRVDDAELLVWRTTHTQPAADLNRASQSWGQTQAGNETCLIGAQNCYWHCLLFFFFPPLLRNFFISE